MVRVRLIGAVAVEVGGSEVPAPASRRAWALIAWLALHPGLHSRSGVAARLWPDVPDASARQSMRSALWSLRQALPDAGEELLVSTRDRIGLRPDVEVDRDVVEQALDGGNLVDAVTAGDGELLAGFDDEWALLARDAHRDRLVQALAQLASSSTQPADGVRWARRAAALDPLSEDAARLLMEQLAAAGDRPAALSVYQRLAERLRRELKVAPSDPTWQLAERIRTGRVGPAPAAMRAPARERAGIAPIVGRRAELAALRQAWRAAVATAGGLAVVHGEAGIGKSRLVGEIIEIARRDGGLVLVGNPPDFGGEALALWVQVCSSAVAALGELPSAPWADVIAALAPSHAPSAGSGQSRAIGAPDLQQARLAESVATLLAAAAASSPLLVVVEDAHAADEASLAVLAHVARHAVQRPVLILVTRRERPLRDALATLEQSHRQRATLRADVALGPLDDAAMGELVRQGAALPAGSVAQVVAVADGNPLLAVEAARALAAGDPMPLGLRGATRAGLARLPEQSRILVETLAVAGRDLEPDEAAARCGVELSAALGPAEDQGLLAHRMDRVGFRHALLRDAVYADLPTHRRAKLHEQAAERLRRDAAPGRAAEAAGHLGAIGRRAEAGELLVRAAARARALGALADASDLLGQATAAVPQDAHAALELADVLAWRGRRGEAAAAFARALELLEAAGDAQAVARAHLRYAEWHYGPICMPTESIDACRRALAVLDGAGLPAPQVRAAVLSVYAWSVALAGDTAHCLQLLERLGELVGDEPEDLLLSAAIDRTTSFAALRQGRFVDGVEPALRSARTALRAGRPDLAYNALLNAAFGQVAAGDLPAALGLLEEAAAATSGHAMLSIDAFVLLGRAWVLAHMGRLDDAAQAAAQARRAADRLDLADLQAVVDAERGRIALRSGDYPTAAALLESALAVPEAAIGRPLARLQRAEALARGGFADQADAELSLVVFEPVRDGDWPETLIARMAAVEGLVAAARGDRETARRRLGEAADGWRRLTPVDLADRMAVVMADLGRPIIGLILPAEELAVVEADLRITTDERRARDAGIR